MTGERVALVLNVGDRVCLWLLVLAAGYVLGYLAIRADRDPAALIAPACVSVPAKASKP